jgi:hypothetical protein
MNTSNENVWDLLDFDPMVNRELTKNLPQLCILNIVALVFESIA